MIMCYENDAESPVDSCHCQACRHVRGKQLPEEFINIYKVDYNGIHEVKLSKALIYRAVSAYICGGFDSKEQMYISLIKALTEQCDKIYKEYSSILATNIHPPFIIKND